jgi:hypothetical protein
VRQLLFKLIMGGDELATRMFNMLRLRREATEKAQVVKELTSSLEVREAELSGLKLEYQQNRVAMEAAYRLEV